jgi:TatA/E family protein of Tat protein translocase
MFGTMGFSELIIILVIVLIIFGAGKLPQIGEGVGKALKGFKKEVHDIPPAETATAAAEPASAAPPPSTPPTSTPPADTSAPKPTAPYTPGPELTPGTTAAMLANLGPQGPAHSQPPRPTVAATSNSQPGAATAAPQQSPPTMEDRMAAPAPMTRGQYPPLPPGAQAKPVAKRPSAVVNKDAVARVQAAQAALKAKAHQTSAGVSPQDMQHFGEGLGDALRTFRQAVADVRGSVDPEMRTIQAEIDAAQKELEQSIEAAKQAPVVEEQSPGKPA